MLRIDHCRVKAGDSTSSNSHWLLHGRPWLGAPAVGATQQSAQATHRCGWRRV